MSFRGQTSQKYLYKWFPCSYKSKQAKLCFLAQTVQNEVIVSFRGQTSKKNKSTSGFHVQTSQNQAKLSFLAPTSPK